MNDKFSELNFFSDMAAKETTIKEFFGTPLLESFEVNFNITNCFISYFDSNNNFLSWTDKRGLKIDYENHPYHKFKFSDAVRNAIFNKANNEGLTYFNVEPKLFLATDIIGEDLYDNSIYCKFINEYFNGHYTLTLSFGMNAYIQITFIKTEIEGNFTKEEIEQYKSIYVYISNFYKNFKKYEQGKIISHIQSNIIARGDKAYFVTDEYLHVLSYNELSKTYLINLFGELIKDDFDNYTTANWLLMIIGKVDKNNDETFKKVIGNYEFTINIYDQKYSNGIIDRYYWITIKSITDEVVNDEESLFTEREKDVATLLYEGKTYQQISNELFISYHTVKKHVENIYKKANVNNKYELIKWLEKRLV